MTSPKKKNKKPEQLRKENFHIERGNIGNIVGNPKRDKA